MDSIEKFVDRNYFIKENVFVYHTNDMDKTVQWFEEILGWYGEVMDRDNEGFETYGYTGDIPPEFCKAQAVPFKGIHFWRGEPVEKVLAIINVNDIKTMHNYVKKNGWDKISDIEETGASPKTCFFTTIDGSILMFTE